MKESDHFDLLGLPRTFALTEADLEASWKQRIAQVHPDRFAAASPAEKRVAMHWSAQLNEAYRVLRDPLTRAQYLCELAGHRTVDQPGVSMNPEFLGQQIEWREALESARMARDQVAIDALAQRISADRSHRMAVTGQLVDQARWDQAVVSLHEWMFVEKFIREIASARRALATTQ